MSNASLEEAEFWRLIEEARSAGEPVDEALVELLEGRSLDELLAFQQRFDAVTGRVHRWDVWAAAYLIGGGCSDDAFSDFRAGLVALGREWFERVVADPDDLAAHPLVVAAAEEDDDEVIFNEEVGFAASTAAEDEEAFWELSSATEDDADAPDLGPGWDFDDQDEMRARLPRLAGLFL